METKRSVLIVEDDPAMRDTCVRILSRAQYQPEAVGDGEAALAKLRSNPEISVALVDLKLPGMNGIEVLEKIRQRCPDIKVVIMTGYATIKSAVQSMKLGAADYLVKPFEKDELLAILAQQFRVEELEKKVERLQSELHGKFGFDNIVGRSKSMEVVFEQIVAACGNRANVLIVGESGTGKELVAKAIHYNGPLRDGPFVVVNCAALPATLIESELFGHKKGAFTGATRDTEGLFRTAESGTILLDEIFEMPLDIQAKLLRVIQERALRPVGGQSEAPIDTRIIAASNEEPIEAIEKGELRKDLFYRLSVILIRVPPLRERRDDICRFLDHFMAKFAKSYDLRVESVLRPAMDILTRYDWPGNVRELEHVVEQWFAMGIKGSVGVSELPAEIVASVRNAANDTAGTHSADVMSLHDSELAQVRKALEAADYNKSKAAGLLGISRKKLYRLLEDTPSLKNRRPDQSHS